MTIRTVNSPVPSFNRITCPINAIRVDSEYTETGRRVVSNINVNGLNCEPSKRFFTSVFSRYGFGDSTFKYFSHEEVFNRIVEKTQDPIRVTIENNGNKNTVLGICKPDDPVIDHDVLIDLLGTRGGVDISKADYGQRYAAIRQANPHRITRSMDDVPTISYTNGIIRSIHTPRSSQPFDIAGDTFGNRFVMDTPIDGYGKPSLYLMLLRYVCVNGAIGYTSVFRSGLTLGKKEDSWEHAFTRAWEGFNNEEGFKAMRDRYEMAAKSWASIGEINRVYKALVRGMHNNDILSEVPEGSMASTNAVTGNKMAKMLEKAGNDGAGLMDGNNQILLNFNTMCGDLSQVYGLANIESLSMKKQRALPAGCKMYELMNFTTEVATHYASPKGANDLQAILGEFLANEYDLEGTCERIGDWKDFMIKDDAAADAYRTAQQRVLSRA